MIFRIPPIGEGVQEAELVAWKVNVGDRVVPGHPLMEVMTDKATSEVPAPFAGTITSLRALPGARLAIGDAVLSYTPAGEEAEGEPASAPPAPEARSVAAPARPARPNGSASPAPEPQPASPAASPATRQLARELGIDLATVAGSGPGGRVLIRDVAPHARPDGPKAQPTPAAVAPPPEAWGKPGTTRPMQGLRRQIAERLAEAHRVVPQASLVEEVDVSALVRTRDELREPFAQAGIKLTYLPFFVRAAALALRDVPIVNASLDEPGERIVLHAGCHVGVAVDTPAGLVVPVVRDADRKDILALAREMSALAEGARRGALKLDDFRGGTFTVSSVGNIAGLFTAPMVTPPQAAILGIGRVIRRPVYDKSGHLVPADLIYLAVSFDHRVLDGGAAAAFAAALAKRLGSPAALLADWAGMG
jgi:pyruvate/2-oxoglutarate dehydrogenase complex dihydrolipoamide acyltransferase (E2) component